jgi:hypothetical protein
MVSLNLPRFDAKVTEKNGKPTIFDPLRRKYVILTPEEWVRQHFVNYLISEKQYPEELLANEITVNLNNTFKRCDTIVYNAFLLPVMILEYKSPAVIIKKTAIDQISRYNTCLKVRYLIVSNGLLHYCCKIDYETQSYSFLKEIPDYGELEG